MEEIQKKKENRMESYETSNPRGRSETREGDGENKKEAVKDYRSRSAEKGSSQRRAVSLPAPRAPNTKGKNATVVVTEGSADDSADGNSPGPKRKLSLGAKEHGYRRQESAKAFLKAFFSLNGIQRNSSRTIRSRCSSSLCWKRLRSRRSVSSMHELSSLLCLSVEGPRADGQERMSSRRHL